MKSRDMTEGNILKLIVLFAIPLFLGNLLQQLYNAFDAIIVGNYVGKEALAAVGSSGPLINVIIAFFMGMSSGASVLISQSLGARNNKALRETVHTAMLVAILLGVILGTLGVFTTPSLLRLMRTPDDIMAEAVAYLRIYFMGLPALTVYNMGAATLTAVGDAKRPLYFLALSSVLNVAGNLYFVLVLGMGVDGVAIATVIAEIVTAILALVVLMRANTEYQLYLSELKIHVPILKQIARIGLPAGIQSSIISFSNIIVQSYINRLGAVAIAGYSACTKLDAFAMLPVQTMSLAVTTFVGQNLGAGQIARARKGVKYAMLMGAVIVAVIALTAFFFGKYPMRIFTPDQEVLDAGAQFLSTFCLGYIALCFTQILPGALRGAGDVRAATIISIICFVPVRQCYLYIISQIHYSITTVALGYPLTWTLAGIIILLYYRRCYWSSFAKKDVPEESAAVL
jgi:putative MATE family efflux protein